MPCSSFIVETSHRNFLEEEHDVSSDRSSTQPLFPSVHVEQKQCVHVLHRDIDLTLGGQEQRGQALSVSEGHAE